MFAMFQAGVMKLGDTCTCTVGLQVVPGVSWGTWIRLCLCTVGCITVGSGRKSVHKVVVCSCGTSAALHPDVKRHIAAVVPIPVAYGPHHLSVICKNYRHYRFVNLNFALFYPYKSYHAGHRASKLN